MVHKHKQNVPMELLEVHTEIMPHSWLTAHSCQLTLTINASCITIEQILGSIHLMAIDIDNGIKLEEPLGANVGST